MVRDVVEVGVVARPHGVRGELRIALHDAGSRSLLSADTVLVDDVAYRVTAARPVQGAVLLRLDGIGDRDAAAALRGAPVCVDRSALDLQEGEVLLADLVGCRVELSDGTSWGQVVEIATGPQDRLVIADGSIERMLPLVDEFVIDIDVAGRRIVVDPPEGLPESER